MSRQTVYAVLGGLVLLVLGGVFGLLTGISVGGNYLSGFEFAGQRGYEATGTIGLWVGAGLGLILGVLGGRSLARRHRAS
ncbi:hypothetical protein [Ornithinimicrobium tianjinense]|uniref:Uncharacterized protein n=1 Tax=Ornithinimicrobium tianjinense TaxID=1195761 RepID=A0A917BIS2_9MICO|nr:hypothetical protein [Ornithinimicrobium tianjinense]GGF41917.1 hypothetical protein GCM10011366_07090 [Ornithinimicrobium tianjinense]